MNTPSRGACLLIAVLLACPALAEEEYSFERSERLVHLIEWREYGPDAFDEAMRENKPVFLLLTAPSWCYWCQVYESEDYLFHPSIFPLINERFVPIYVDADKRMDLTRQYLEGGWPSTTLLTPGRERITGWSGPRPVTVMESALQEAVSYVASHDEVNAIEYEYKAMPSEVPTEVQLRTFLQDYAVFIERVHDPLYGGFGPGQKFPQPRTLLYALDLYESTGEEPWLQMVRTTLQHQYTRRGDIATDYNLFDPVEGGFHRYGTQRDWTPPHYEKMLYDNARLLRLYHRLGRMDPENEEAADVVDMTLAFMEREWWDASAGGFWGNSDVHGEDAYYGKDPRPSPSPRVERTKYTDWNSETVVTFLHLWNATGNTTHRDMARRTLDFLIEEIVTDRGVFHFMDENGTKGVRGSLLDDAYLLLACMDGYAVLGDERYLDTARKLGDNALEHMYDWHGGGFFERNSPDAHLYAPGEDIHLAKPPAENGIMAYALLRLHVATGEKRYLITGLRTMGAMRNETLVLDTGYYHVLAANLVLDHGLLTEHERIRDDFQEEEQERREGFWLDARLGRAPTVKPAREPLPVEGPTSELEGPPSEPSVPKAPLTILLVVALMAGLISFASPCTLSILPAYLAFTLRAHQKGLRAMTLAFLLGMISTFTLLGMSATAMGMFLQTNVVLFSKAAGLAIIAFGLYIIAGGNFAGPRMTVHGPTSAAGAFLFGAAMGISWTPCVGPVLVSILILASTTASMGSGGMLLFAYGCGLAIPLVIVSFYLDSIDRNGRFWRALRGREIRVRLFGHELTAHTTVLVSGLLFLFIGTLILTDSLIALNGLLSVSWVQGWVYGAEERLLALAGWS
ncbi:MAG: cytochrome c biogenesis protein CcdA [Candidatus Undinarchaeales archaeon]|jgi:hypothetical protein|nr:cytochrome c biogenesis protein CcdA [Candidatus Undinarchaeales archaeon]MDP7492417.1 cytochrome c biogenesis protein CcdA [Candidatus Undinarchaeales archaeon]